MSNVVFIDSRIEEIEPLIAGIGSNERVVILEPTRDGVIQIANALASEIDLQSIQIVSHGSSGTLTIGSTVLTNENLDLYRTQLATIGTALSISGDLLLYGCFVGAGESGGRFIENLAAYTGADVASSDDATGNVSLGGDWGLEKATGSIESGLTLSDTTKDGYEHVFLGANNPATGSVAITGNRTQGQTLTALNNLADVDGIGTISYQWRADGNAISGATARTFIVTQAQVGKTISVTASYTDALGTTESVTSSATNAIANVNDTPIGSVSISGKFVRGELVPGNPVTASAFLIDADGVGVISYQWQESIDSQTWSNKGTSGRFLNIDNADLGRYFRVLAQYTDGHGTTEYVLSQPTKVSNVLFSVGTIAALVTEAVAFVVTATNLDSIRSFVNDVPVAGFLGNRVAGVSAALSLNVSTLFSDLDGDTLTFSATGLPAGLAIDSSTGLITGTTPSSTGVHHVTVTGTDPSNATANLLFELSIASGYPVTVNIATRGDFALPGVTGHELINAAPIGNHYVMGSNGQFSAMFPNSNLALGLSRGTADYLVAGKGPVTAADALDALKLSVGLDASKGNSWKELIAADLTHDGRVTAADALEILKTSVGINTIQPSWVFIPTDNGMNPNLDAMTRTSVTYKNELNLSSITAPTSAFFTGILVGDVNNSWVIPA